MTQPLTSAGQEDKKEDEEEGEKAEKKKKKKMMMMMMMMIMMKSLVSCVKSSSSIPRESVPIAAHCAVKWTFLMYSPCCDVTLCSRPRTMETASHSNHAFIMYADQAHTP